MTTKKKSAKGSSKAAGKPAARTNGGKLPAGEPPAHDENRDGDADGLGCARAAIWSIISILAVAALAVGLREWLA